MARTPGPSLTLEDVTAAGVRVLEREGLKGFSLSSVAADLGVKPPSLYHHLRGIEGLKEAVAVEGWSLLVQSVPPLPDDPRAALRTLATSYRAFTLAHPDLYRLMGETPFRADNPRLQPLTVEALRLFQSLEVPPEHAVHLVRGLRSVLHGFVQLELAGQFQLYAPAEDSFAWMTELVFRGLGLPEPDEAEPDEA